MEKLHTTIGLYANLTFKMNGVKPEHLETHIEYNKTHRFGRALFVDGKCVYKGYLSDDQIKLHEQLFKNPKYIATKCNVPYQ